MRKKKKYFSFQEWKSNGLLCLFVIWSPAEDEWTRQFRGCYIFFFFICKRAPFMRFSQLSSNLDTILLGTSCVTVHSDSQHVKMLPLSRRFTIFGVQLYRLRLMRQCQWRGDMFYTYKSKVDSDNISVKRYSQDAHIISYCLKFSTAKKNNEYNDHHKYITLGSLSHI